MAAVKAEVQPETPWCSSRLGVVAIVCAQDYRRAQPRERYTPSRLASGQWSFPSGRVHRCDTWSKWDRASRAGLGSVADLLTSGDLLER